MKILVASSTNDDDSADPVTAAGWFPWPAGSEIRVVSVVPMIQPALAGLGPAELNASEVQLTADAAAKTAAANGAAQLQSHGFRAESVVLEGDPETAITGDAREWGADLIVVGSHDRSRVERLLLGSVSQSVVKNSPCAVLVIKHRSA